MIRRLVSGMLISGITAGALLAQDVVFEFKSSASSIEWTKKIEPAGYRVAMFPGRVALADLTANIEFNIINDYPINETKYIATIKDGVVTKLTSQDGATEIIGAEKDSILGQMFVNGFLKGNHPYAMKSSEEVNLKMYFTTMGDSVDTDNDGVIDALDKCPSTSSDAEFTNKEGCSIDDDLDGDGIPYIKDECQGTASGVKVNAKGCEIQFDSEITFGIGEVAGVEVKTEGASIYFNKKEVPAISLPKLTAVKNEAGENISIVKFKDVYEGDDFAIEVNGNSYNGNFTAKETVVKGAN